MTAQDILNEYKQPPPLNKDEHLYCFAIIRRDLNMETGKLSAQAGHAYTDVIALAEQHQPQRVRDYRKAHKGGSKVTLKARNENQLIRALNEAREAGIPAIQLLTLITSYPINSMALHHHCHRHRPMSAR